MIEGLVSIIIPVYNTEAFLSQCIKSVIAQSYTHWELLIIDDGSTDGSLDIVANFVKSDPRIKLYQSNAGNVSVARNMGIDNARGQWVFFLDSDDYILDNCLEVLISCANNFENVNLIQGSYYVENLYENPNNLVLSWKCEIRKPYAEIVLTGDDFLYKHKISSGIVWGSLLDNDLLHRYNLRFDDKIYAQEDIEFMIRLLTVENIQAIFIKEPIYVYRWGRINSLTSPDSNVEVSKLKNVKTLNSLINSSESLLKLRNYYSKKTKKIVTQLILENLTGIIGGMNFLNNDQREEIKTDLTSKFKKIPYSKKGGARNILAFLYNINPKLAIEIRKLLYKK